MLWPLRRVGLGQWRRSEGSTPTAAHQTSTSPISAGVSCCPRNAHTCPSVACGSCRSSRVERLTSPAQMERYRPQEGSSRRMSGTAGSHGSGPTPAGPLMRQVSAAAGSRAESNSRADTAARSSSRGRPPSRALRMRVARSVGQAGQPVRPSTTSSAPWSREWMMSP